MPEQRRRPPIGFLPVFVVTAAIGFYMFKPWTARSPAEVMFEVVAPLVIAAITASLPILGWKLGQQIARATVQKH